MQEHLQKSKINETNFYQFKSFVFYRGLEICQLKNDIESNFTTVEQAILEFPVSLIIRNLFQTKIFFIQPIANLNQITLQNLPSLIEQAESECMKHKRNRIKEERELENRRVCIRKIKLKNFTLEHIEYVEE